MSTKLRHKMDFFDRLDRAAKEREEAKHLPLGRIYGVGRSRKKRKEVILSRMASMEPEIRNAVERQRKLKANAMLRLKGEAPVIPVPAKLVRKKRVLASTYRNVSKALPKAQGHP